MFQFHELKVANIQLKRKIAETRVVMVDTSGWIKERLDARRTFHAVRIHSEDKDEEFLHVQYSGPDAVRVRILLSSPDITDHPAST
jgi:hypothetical protein